MPRRPCYPPPSWLTLGPFSPPPASHHPLVSHPPPPHTGAAAGVVTPVRVALTVLLPFALGYLLSYLHRTVTAMIATDLVAELEIGPELLGALGSAYFLAFAAAQLPVGVALDRWGPRRVEGTLLLLAAAGSLWFALAGSAVELTLARGLIGLGVSACLMAAFKANMLWWPPQRLPLINGLIMATGGIGALAATTPVAAVLQVTDWRGLFLGLTVLTAGSALLILLVVPEKPGQPGTTTLARQVRDALAIYASPVLWKIAPAVVLSQAGFLAYMSLWAGPWFRDVTGLDAMAKAAALQSMAVGLTLGFVATGLLADRLGRLGVPTRTTAGACIALSVAAQAGLLLGGGGHDGWLWMAVAFFSTGAMLGYAALSQVFPAHLGGRVNTALNLMVFVLAFALQAGIGRLLGQFPELPGGGYHPDGHRLGLALLAGAQLLALIWMAVPARRR